MLSCIFIFIRAQAVVEEELIKYINSVASAAMVSDMILSSDEMSTTSSATVDSTTEEKVTVDSTINDIDTSDATHSSSHPSQQQQQIHPKKMAQADSNQLMIKPWMAEMIKDFKRQLFKEASFYLQTMDVIMEYGDAYLAPDAMICK